MMRGHYDAMMGDTMMRDIMMGDTMMRGHYDEGTL